MSIYQGGQLTQNAVVKETEKILVAFPKIEAQMVSLLRDRFKANGFNDAKMIDAVNFVIDNYKGWDKLPAIGDFVSYDKTIKVFLWTELLEKTKEDSPQTRAEYLNNFIAIDFYGEQRFARKEDVERYNLKKWHYNKDK